MSNDKEFGITDLPGYMEWSERKLAEGESEAYLAHLDATTVWELPEDAAKMTEKDYEEMLAELKVCLEKARHPE